METDYERRVRETNDRGYLENLRIYLQRIREGKPVGIVRKVISAGSDESDSCAGSRLG